MPPAPFGADLKNRPIEAWLWRWWTRGYRPEWSKAPGAALHRCLIGFAIAGLWEPIVDQCYAEALVQLFDDYYGRETVNPLR